MSMSLKRRLEGEVEIRATGGDAHHEVYKNGHHRICEAAPHFMQNCDLHEGEPGTPGATYAYTYIIDGKSYPAKSKLEEIDEEKKLIKYRCVEGDVLNDYKSMIGTCQVIPKDNETSILKWILEYEKVHPGVPEPTALLDAFLNSSKDIDDHHHGIKK